MRLCKKHGAEYDVLVGDWDVMKMMGWWIKSLGGAEHATKHILGFD